MIDTGVSRMDRVVAALHDAGLEALFIAPSAEMTYLTGYAGHASERPTLFVLEASGRSTWLTAAFEASLLPQSQARVVTYGETDDPIAQLFDALGGPDSIARAGISDQARAAVLLALQAAAPGIRFISATGPIRSVRMCKDREELELLREAAVRTDRAFAAFIQTRFAGRSEHELAADLREALAAEGLASAGWGPIVASGAHAASPHHQTSAREVHEGDAVVLDFGGQLGGYNSDITRTVHVGTPDDGFRQVYDLVQEAQEAGVRAVRPGVSAASVDAACRDLITAAGLGAAFNHRTGHGLGLDVHEEPYIRSDNDLPLQPGMVFSVEPGIYLAGRFGARIEDIVAVTESGVERLNTAPHDLQIVY